MEPKIRLKGFSGEWEEVLIGELFNFKNGLNKDKDSFGFGTPIINYTDVYRNRGLHSYEIKGKVNLTIDEQKRFGVKKGDVFFTRTSETPQEVGFSSVLLDDVDNCSFSGFVLRARPVTDMLIPLFCENCFSTKNVRNSIMSSSTYTTRALTNGTVLSKISIFFPSKEEQQAIASFFSSLDSQISASSSRLESLKQIKAASLQSMFPQEGETVPKVRFKGFEGEWKTRSFSEMSFHAGMKNRDNLPLESYSISNEFGFIPQNEQFENGGTMTNADKRMYYIVTPQSFAYNPARINVGSLGYYEGKKDVIVSSLYEVFKTKEDIDDKFLLYWFKTDVFKKMIDVFQEGGVRQYFFYDKLCMCNVLVPSPDEQLRIASYFTHLDKQISLQAQRLEKLKQIKAACLDNMFV